MRIKHWPKSERPRERLMEFGTEVLSDAELVAVLLRTGIKGKDALALARELLTRFGGLRGLLSVGRRELAQVKGLGTSKIAAFLSAIEIAKRQLKQDILGRDVVRDPKSIMNYLTSSMRDQKKEVFKVLFLDKANRLIAAEDLFEGTVDETVVHPREVLQAALEKNASSIILVHNHPSGRVQPSSEDQAITRKLHSICTPLGIRIMDHIIVGDNQYFSFNEANLLA